MSKMKESFVSSLLLLILFMTVNFNLLISQEEKKVDEKQSPGLISFTAATDLVSRYLWRGQALEQSFCVQPTLAINIGSLTIGTWGSYSIMREQLDEQDLYLTYNLATSSGAFTFNLWDYHNSNIGKQFFNFNSDSGAHILELSIGYTGPETFPINFLAAYNLFNDKDKSPYFEVGYTFNVNDIKLNLFCGATKGICAYYGVPEDKFAIINTGVSATKTIKITNDFSIPLNLSYIINPYIEKSFLVFKISL